MHLFIGIPKTAVHIDMLLYLRDTLVPSSGGEADDGCTVLREGSIHSSNGSSGGSGCWSWGEVSQLLVHHTMKHGCLCLKTNTTHHPHCLNWVLPCINNRAKSRWEVYILITYTYMHN